jgi:DNA-binding response OmpR family regulator
VWRAGDTAGAAFLPLTRCVAARGRSCFKWGQVCSRDELIKHLYPEDSSLGGGGVTDNRLDSVVKRLRKQIEPNPKEPKYILTVRGHGFRLDDSAA